MTEKLISSTALAKLLNIKTEEMFQKLINCGLIVKEKDSWVLTEAGVQQGGTYKMSPKAGRYIAWPEEIEKELDWANIGSQPGLITVTAIGKHFELPATRINSILSELGWIKKDPIKGWQLTQLGKRFGGVQDKYNPSGIPFVRWPNAILINPILASNIKESKGEDLPALDNHITRKSDASEFREKFRPEHRAQDGHYVRSKSEIIIDNWLYNYKIVHSYERKLAIEEDMYCDFYLPTGKVYIEYWGSEDKKYLARKQRKLEIYSKYNFNLIQLEEKDISNLEDVLPARLIEFGIPIES